MNQSRIVLIGITLAMLMLSACTAISDKPLTQRVADAPNEVLYYDVLGEVPGNEVSVFGVQLFDREEDVIALHGEPDVRSDYRFGTIENLEYHFGLANETFVVYNMELGVVKGILLTKKANNLLHGNTVLNHTLSEMYSILGAPTIVVDLNRQRKYVYDELGYEVFRTVKGTDRIYFTSPNRGIQGPGEDVEQDEELCAQVITPAVSVQTNECIEFPRPCLVPEGWQVVESCEQ